MDKHHAPRLGNALYSAPNGAASRHDLAEHLREEGIIPNSSPVLISCRIPWNFDWTRHGTPYTTCRGWIYLDQKAREGAPVYEITE